MNRWSTCPQGETIQIPSGAVKLSLLVTKDLSLKSWANPHKNTSVGELLWKTRKRLSSG